MGDGVKSMQIEEELQATRKSECFVSEIASGMWCASITVNTEKFSGLANEIEIGERLCLGGLGGVSEIAIQESNLKRVRVVIQL